MVMLLLNLGGEKKWKKNRGYSIYYKKPLNLVHKDNFEILEFMNNHIC